MSRAPRTGSPPERFRFATAVPFHVALGMIMGMFLAANDKGHAPSATVLALIVPVMLHGLYDWPLFALEELNGGSVAEAVVYNGLFAAVMLATGALICFPVASVLHRQALASRRAIVGLRASPRRRRRGDLAPPSPRRHDLRRHRDRGGGLARSRVPAPGSNGDHAVRVRGVLAARGGLDPRFPGCEPSFVPGVPLSLALSRLDLGDSRRIPEPRPSRHILQKM